MRGERVLVGMLFFCAVILLSTVILPIGIANAEDIEYHVDYYGVMQPLRIATIEEPAYSGDHTYTADTLGTTDNPSRGTMLKALIWPPMGKSISSPITKVRVVTYIECIDGDYNSQSLEYRLYAYNMETGELTRKIHDDTWPRTGNTPSYFPLSYGLKTYDDTIICDTKKSALGEKETLILLSICHHFGAKSRHTKYAAHFDTNDYPAYMEVFTSDGKSTKYYIHDSFTTPTVDDDGLLAYYPFNGNANDEGGNGLHGSVYGASLTEDRFGNADNAFLFDNPTTIGTNRIVVTDGYGFNRGETLESLTISLWFELYAQSDDCSYIITLNSMDGSACLHFYLDGRVAFTQRTVDAGIINQRISADVSQDNWHHVVGTWDGSVMRLYVDGVLRDEATFPWTLSTPSSPTNRGNTIGANYDPDPNNPAHVCSFNGKVDEVRIYSQALTELEIKALYDEQEGGCCRITNWKTMCQGVYSPGQKVGAEMEFENLMGGGYNFKGVILIRSPTGDEYTNRDEKWVPSAPNPHGKFAAGDALYVTIPEGASAGNYDMKLELWNDDTDELCDATEWKEDLFTVEGGGTPSNLLENPGFESGELDPWYSTEYYDPYKKCEWIIIDVDSEARYEGDYGAYIDIRCSLDAWGRIIQEPVEIKPGEKLAVEAKVMYKGDLSDGYAELWLVFLDADKKALDHVFKKYYESDFGAEDKWLSALLPATTAPSNAKYVRIMVGLAYVKSCRMNIDDVILKYGSAIENHPPTVIRVEPTSDSIAIEPGNTQEFKVKAEDLDEEVHNNLKMIEWFVDDVLMETASADGKSAEVSFSYTFENAGTFSAKATVYDEQMEEDSVTCEVNVGVTGDFAIKVVDVTGETVEGASVMLCKYKTAEYPGTEILVTNSGETDSEGFYFPPHDKIETCDLLVAKKNDWFNSENLQNAGEIPKVIKLPLVYEMLAEDLITVDGLDYKLYVWRSVDSLNPKRNRFFSEVHRRGGADLESGFFGFTKDESVDVEHDTKLIWFSYWSLEDRFVGTPYMELPVRATYDPVVLQIPSSTTIDEKKILQDGAGRLIGLIPRVALVYAFYELISDTFWWEEEMVCYGEYDSGIDMDENKYDTTFEAWSASGSLDDHLKTVVYEETMEFPEVGEYRVVPFIQFTPEILPPKTCIWAKEIRISVFEK